MFQCALFESNNDTALNNKKFELMLTRRAKAYSSSCSQITLVHLQLFRCN